MLVYKTKEKCEDCGIKMNFWVEHEDHVGAYGFLQCPKCGAEEDFSEYHESLVDLPIIDERGEDRCES